MTMQAIVKNFRGIKEATITISQIALVAGINGAGKTSIARAVGAAVTGKPIPYSKVTKKECDIMLRHGTKAAMAGIGTNDGATQFEWPKAEVISNGKPPVASEVAAGLTDIFTMPAKDALGYMIGLLKANPTLDDIKGLLEQNEIENADKTAAAIWKSIEEKGWDGSHAQAKETGQRLKGAWQHITGTAYGKKKADDWYPEGFEDAVLKEAHESELIRLRGELEDEIGKGAVNKAEREQLQKLADMLPDLKKRSAEATELLDEASAALKKIEDELRTTPNPSAKAEYACPHCDGSINVTAVSGSEFIITKAEAIDESKLKAARMYHAELCGKQQKAQSDVAAARSVLNQATLNESNAMKAKESLSKLGSSAVSDNASKIELIKQEIATTENRRDMAKKYLEATKTATQITANQFIIDLLDETGLRKTKLGQCLDAFAAEYIKPVCSDLGIPPLLIDADMSVNMGDVPYQMLSASEQFRVRTVLQIATAKLEKADLIIIDGADILDKAGRAKLLATVMASKIPAIICITLNNSASAPNLEAAGVGHTYWIDGGVCKQVSPANERAAA